KREGLGDALREGICVAKGRGGPRQQDPNVPDLAKSQTMLERDDGLFNVPFAEVHVADSEISGADAKGVVNGFRYPDRFFPTCTCLCELAKLGKARSHVGTG